MKFSLTPFLENNIVIVKPMTNSDFEALLKVANDPILWEHHPISSGYTKTGFEKFFNEAIGIGSLLIIDKVKNAVIGSTRLYGYNEKENSIVIGHTFISREYWGSGYNKSIKKLMLDYAFTHVNKVVFYVVENNIRSKKVFEKIRAIAKGTVTRNYEGKEHLCVLFEIDKKFS